MEDGSHCTVCGLDGSQIFQHEKTVVQIVRYVHYGSQIVFFFSTVFEDMVLDCSAC